MRIGLDLDGVLAKWDEAAAKWFNKTYSYNFPLGSQPSWNWLEEQVKPEEWDAFWQADNVVFWDRIPPYMGSFKFLQALAKKGEVVVITSRPRFTRPATYFWLARYFDMELLAGVNFLKGKEKYLVKCDVLIEDNLDNAISYASYHLHSQICLMDKPYNQVAPNLDPAYIVRCATYEEVLKALD